MSNNSDALTGDGPPARWILDWQPVIDRIGTQMDEPGVRFGPDVVELGAIRRWLEPLEFDCPLHRDADVARAHGFPEVIAPYTSVWSFILPAIWQPGDAPTFAEASRDAQPWRSAIADDVIPGAPETSAMFGTGVSMEFLRPPHLGERIGAGPRRLLDCVPKRTSVGHGAFITFDRHLVTGDLEPVCRVQAQVYVYNPHARAGSDA
jgi:hypothetical protein